MMMLTHSIAVLNGINKRATKLVRSLSHWEREHTESAAPPAANSLSPPTHWSSRSEVRGRDRLARQRRGRAGERDAALLQAIDVVCRLERLHDVLLDDDQRAAFGDDRGQAGVDLAHHDGRETEADLVAEEEFRIGHERAPERDHLLLAARERGARHVAALGQRREQFVDPRQAPRPRPAELAADEEVLLDRERGEQAAPFGNERNA